MKYSSVKCLRPSKQTQIPNTKPPACLMPIHTNPLYIKPVTRKRHQNSLFSEFFTLKQQPRTVPDINTYTCNQLCWLNRRTQTADSSPATASYLARPRPLVIASIMEGLSYMSV